MTRYALLLILALPQVANPPLVVKTPPGFDTSGVTSNLLVISNPEPLVTIDKDGKITYGKDYTPDKAARAFWEAMAGKYPCKERGSK